MTETGFVGLGVGEYRETQFGQLVFFYLHRSLLLNLRHFLVIEFKQPLRLTLNSALQLLPDILS
jgi:hypothetical protein